MQGHSGRQVKVFLLLMLDSAAEDGDPFRS